MSRKSAATVLLVMGRITGTALAGMVAMFIIGEGFPNLFHSPLNVVLQTAAFMGAVAGCLIGWKNALAGGVTVIACMIAFNAVCYAYAHRLAGGAFPLFFIPGILYLSSYALARPSAKPSAAL